MTSYETLFVVRPDIDEDDLNKVIGRVEDVVKSSEGTIVESQVWGKKRLAYEVKKYTEGIYVKVNFDAPPAVDDQWAIFWLGSGSPDVIAEKPCSLIGCFRMTWTSSSRAWEVAPLGYYDGIGQDRLHKIQYPSH